MVQINELKAAIARRGVTQRDVAKVIGISEKSFTDRMKKGVFGSDEIDKMIDYLAIDDPLFVFFGRRVTCKVPDDTADSKLGLE